jgi:hypothetical protein
LVVADAAYAGETTFGGRIFSDITSRNNKDGATGAKSPDSGLGIDVTRFYFTAIYKHDDVWSANFTADICDKINIGGTKSARCEVFIKKAYVQAHFSDLVSFRLGSADMAWVPYIEEENKYRYFEPVLIDHYGFGTSTDWGLHYYGRAGIVSYQLSAVNGGTYNESSTFRNKSIDVEGRLAIEPFAGFKAAIGGYTGHRGQEPKTHVPNTLYQKTERLNAMVAYSTPVFRVGGEWFHADDWNSIAAAPQSAPKPRQKSDEAEGYSAWAAFVINPKLEVFGRYDSIDFNKQFAAQSAGAPRPAFNPSLNGPEGTYYHIGLQYAINSAYLAAFGWKHADSDFGRSRGPVGTIGSTDLAKAKSGSYDELGVWTQFRW